MAQPDQGPEGSGWRRCTSCRGSRDNSTVSSIATPPPPGVRPTPPPDEGDAPDFVVVPSDQSDRAVQAWSRSRLQFEPRGWQLEFRRQVRSAVSRLSARELEVLHATFASSEGHGFDVENVLFYNVGTAGFSASCGSGVRFERAFTVPPSPSGATLSCHHRYEVTGMSTGFRHWRLNPPVATVETAPFRPLSSSSKPPTVWHATKLGAVDARHALANGDVYGVEIALKVPNTARLNVAAVSKPLLDGLLAGLDCHDGTDVDYIADVVSREAGIEPSLAATLLMTSKSALFGPRRAIWKRGHGVQWNPPDDRCVAVVIAVERSRRQDWRATASISTAIRR